MRRWPWMLLALLAFSLLPSRGTELGQLRPASIIYIESENRQIKISTDTMDTGYGETLDAALKDLHAAAPGYLFLDTVENLLLQKNTVTHIPQLRQLLRPGVRVCYAASADDLEAAAKYLHTHVPTHTLSDETKAYDSLIWKEERYILEKQ